MRNEILAQKLLLTWFLPRYMRSGAKNLFLFYFLIFKQIFSFGPYFIEPVIAGLDMTTKLPFICSMDLIGCINFATDFVVAGTSSCNLYGICESLFQPDMVFKVLIYFLI